MTTVTELLKLRSAGKVKLHHSALARGYVSRKTDGYVTKYSGKFGTGYIWHKPNTKSTQYYTVSYYILTKK